MDPRELDREDLDDAPVIEPTGQLQPDAVTILAGPMVTREQAPESGAYSNLSFAGNASDTPVCVLQRDPDRVYAELRAGGVGPLWVGTLAQCNQVLAGQTLGGGYQLPTGSVLPVHHQGAVWVCSDGAHAVTVSVLNERRTQQ